MGLDPTQVSVPAPSTYPNSRTYPFATTFDASRLTPDQAPVKSVRNFFRTAVAKNPNNSCVGWRESNESDYSWVTYKQLSDHVTSLQAAFANLNIQKGQRIGLYARNCPQWTTIQYAAISQGIVFVPIYDTLGPNIVEYVSNHADLQAIFVSPDNYPKLAQVRSTGKIPTVTNVIVIGCKGFNNDPQTDNVVKEADDEHVMSISSLIASVEGKQPEEPELELDDMLVIMYTSGTTGNPKGVVHTHRSFVSSVISALAYFKHWGEQFTPEDCHISYLPLSHIFEQQAQALIICCGGRIGFYQGNIKLLLSDLTALKPTVFTGVPRVYARFQENILANVEKASAVKKFVFRAALGLQLAANRHFTRVGPLDAIVFGKIRQQILPKGRLGISGSAPLSGQTNDFLKVCLNMPICQGYGLTETVGGVICSVPNKSNSGSCGGPLPGVYVKLRDLPDMGYTTQDKPFPRGEVCLKGDFLFTEYYRNEKATAEAFDEEGYFRTGDVGQWIADGSLEIIDRAKNLFKLSQGEYVSPENLEQEYAKAKFISQIFVYGNSLHSNLLAVIVPDVEQSKNWGNTNHSLSDINSIIAAPEYKKELLEQLEKIRAESNFKKYEAIKECIFEINVNELGQGFTVDNDLMTPSFKLKRPQLKNKYGEALDALYSKIE